MKKIDNEKLENLPYDDIAYEILLSENHKMKLQTLFKKVGEIAGLDSKFYEDKIIDFFELLSTDKRFIMLENGFWDLRDNHSHKIKIEEEDVTNIDDDETLDETNEEENEEIEEEDIYYDETELDDDEDEDDYKELVIVDDKDIDNDIS